MELLRFQERRRGEIAGLKMPGASIAFAHSVICFRPWLKEGAYEGHLYWGMGSRFRGSNGWGCWGGFETRRYRVRG